MGTVNGADTVGGFAAYNSGTISNCYYCDSVSTVFVSGGERVGGLVGNNASGTVSNSYSMGNVRASKYVGGLVGYIQAGTVENCYSKGIVIGDAYRIGGLVGHNSGTVKNCYSAGSVSGAYDVGGLVGRNEVGGTVKNCYSTDNVIGYYNYIGGLIGYNVVGGTVTNSYSTGSVRGIQYVGGLVGINYGTVSNSFYDKNTSGRSDTGKGTPKTTENMKNVRTYTDPSWSTGLTSPWDFVGNPYYDTGNSDIWNIHPLVNNGYPFLTKPADITDQGFETGPSGAVINETNWGSNQFYYKTTRRSGNFSAGAAIDTTGDDTRRLFVNVNFSGKVCTSITYWYRISSVDTTNQRQMRLVGSIDSTNGTNGTWFVLRDWVNITNVTSWTQFSANQNLDYFSNQPNCYIKIQAKRTSGSTQRTLYVDDFRIVTVAPSLPS
jgi:hypothetical protein